MSAVRRLLPGRAGRPVRAVAFRGSDGGEPGCAGRSCRSSAGGSTAPPVSPARSSGSRHWSPPSKPPIPGAARHRARRLDTAHRASRWGVGRSWRPRAARHGRVPLTRELAAALPGRDLRAAIVTRQAACETRGLALARDRCRVYPSGRSRRRRRRAMAEPHVTRRSSAAVRREEECSSSYSGSRLPRCWAADFCSCGRLTRPLRDLAAAARAAGTRRPHRPRGRGGGARDARGGERLQRHAGAGSPGSTPSGCGRWLPWAMICARRSRAAHPRRDAGRSRSRADDPDARRDDGDGGRSGRLCARGWRQARPRARRRSAAPA